MRSKTVNTNGCVINESFIEICDEWDVWLYQGYLWFKKRSSKNWNFIK